MAFENLTVELQYRLRRKVQEIKVHGTTMLQCKHVYNFSLLRQVRDRRGIGEGVAFLMTPESISIF